MFNNVRPNSVEELLEAINQQFYYIFAGGTDLMIRKRQWQGAERRFDRDIIYIAHLDELNGIHETEDTYEIYTLVTQSDMAESSLLPEYLKVPYSQMATIGIRNVATVGGNIINAASVGDSLPLLYALDASIVLRSIDGRRTLAITDLILDKYKTTKKQNEILERVIIPKTHFDGYFYKKLGQRKASILSKVSVFILYNRNPELEIRIAIGAVNDTPIRLIDEEKRLAETGDIEGYLKALEGAMHSSTDKRSTKEYKEQITLRLVRNYLEEIFQMKR